MAIQKRIEEEEIAALLIDGIETYLRDSNFGNNRLTSILCKYINDDKNNNSIVIQHDYFSIIDKILTIMKEGNWL